MSEFHDVLTTVSTCGDGRSNLVEKAMGPYVLEQLSRYRAEAAATQVAELGVVAGSIEAIPEQRQVAESELNGTVLR